MACRSRPTRTPAARKNNEKSARQRVIAIGQVRNSPPPVAWTPASFGVVPCGHLEAVVLALLREPIEAVEQGVFVGVGRVLINRVRLHSPTDVRFAPTSGEKADVPGDPSRATTGLPYFSDVSKLHLPIIPAAPLFAGPPSTWPNRLIQKTRSRS